jgi:hypothetical protein
LGASDIESLQTVRSPVRHVALEGAKSSHALTEYLIQPFRVELTDSGKSSLLRCLAANPERFEWFSPKELLAGTNSGGATAFVDALKSETSVGELGSGLFEVSIGDTPPFPEPVDIPGVIGEPISVGITGRERTIHVGLSQDEIGTLCLLAAARRNDPVEQLAEGVPLVSATGWVLLDSEPLLATVKSLASKLSAASLPLLTFHGKAVRFNRENPYFSPRLLSIKVEDERRGKSYRLQLARSELHSPLGDVSKLERVTTLSETLGAAVYALALGDSGQAQDNLDTVKRVQRDLRDFLDQVGARLLVRQVDGMPELAVGNRI